MKLYNKHSNRDIMVIGSWLSCFICIPLMHALVINIDWMFCVKWCVLMSALTSLPAAFCGWTSDRYNLRQRYGNENTTDEKWFLRSLEDQVEQGVREIRQRTR